MHFVAILGVFVVRYKYFIAKHVVSVACTESIEEFIDYLLSSISF
jgi:hypothetical protein